MSSFYGGQKGISFELVKTYESKERMISEFASPNCPVAYGQYVSIGSNDENRGQIYRRTMNLANGANGAELVGQISGENGINAKIDIVPFSSMSSVEEVHELSFANGDFVSGKDIQDNSIKYKTQIQYDANGDIYKTNYGIQFPYNVIEFETGSTDKNYVEIETKENNPFYQSYLLKFPLSMNGDSIRQMALVTSSNRDNYVPIYDNPVLKNRIPDLEINSIIAYQLEESASHDNYIKLDITEGDPAELGLYEKNGNNFIQTTDHSVVSGKDYYSREQHVSTSTYWYKLCDFTDVNIEYDDTIKSFVLLDENLQTTIVPLKNIKNLSLSENGIITAYYDDGSASSSSYQSSQELNPQNPLKWITNIIPFNESGEKFVIQYNTGDEQIFECPVNSLSKIEYTDKGKLLATYTKSVVTQNFSQIEIESEANPSEEGWYEISSSYYNEIVTKIRDGEITTQEDYQEAIELVIIEANNASDLYVPTTDLTVVRYAEGTIEKAYFEYKGNSYLPNVQDIGTLKGIESVSYDKDEHKLVITYNTETGGEKDKDEFDTELRGIDYIRYDENVNKLVIKYTDSDEEQEILLELRVTGIRFNEYSQLVFSFNDGREITVSSSIVYPRTIQFNDETQKLEMVLNTAYTYIPYPITTTDDPPVVIPIPENPKEAGCYELSENPFEYFLTEDTIIDQAKTYYKQEINNRNKVRAISPALNYIQQVAIDDNYNLLVLFSDPDKQGEVSYQDINKWLNLGSVKDQTGLYIDLHIKPGVDNPGYTSLQETIDTLNQNYPNGYNNDVHACVAVGGDWEPKTVYAFDNSSNPKTWYLLGTYATQQFIAANTIDAYRQGQAKDVEALPNGGLWFVIENRMDDYDEDIEYFGTSWEDF